MECARLSAVNGGLEALLGDLNTFQEQIAGALKQLNHINQNLQRDAEALLFAEADMCD